MSILNQRFLTFGAARRLYFRGKGKLMLIEAGLRRSREVPRHRVDVLAPMRGEARGIHMYIPRYLTSVRTRRRYCVCLGGYTTAATGMPCTSRAHRRRRLLPSARKGTVCGGSATSNRSKAAQSISKLLKFSVELLSLGSDHSTTRGGPVWLLINEPQARGVKVSR